VVGKQEKLNLSRNLEAAAGEAAEKIIDTAVAIKVFISLLMPASCQLLHLYSIVLNNIYEHTSAL